MAFFYQNSKMFMLRFYLSAPEAEKEDEIKVKDSTIKIADDLHST
jgi:hypothetical protein